MKKNMSIMLILLLGTGLAKAQSQEAQQLLLNVEKLTQFRQILSDMKTGYQLVSTGYNSIKDLSEGNFSLHKTFLDALMQVSPGVRKYKRVTEIISVQLSLVREYKAASKRFKAQGIFSAQELSYTAGVYDRLISASLENLDDLATVITAGKLRMSDTERISEIDRIYLDMQDRLSFLRHFNGRTSLLALGRKKEQADIAASRAAYGIKP
ncbi:MAG: TerB family tellurite resistance protein [Bacteroidota bacterium]